MIIARNKMMKIMTIKTTTTIFNLTPIQLYDLEHTHIRNLF
jgi:hypothetical protein